MLVGVRLPEPTLHEELLLVDGPIRGSARVLSDCLLDRRLAFDVRSVLGVGVDSVELD